MTRGLADKRREQALDARLSAFYRAALRAPAPRLLLATVEQLEENARGKRAA